MSHDNGNTNNDRAMLAALQAKIAELQAENKALASRPTGSRELTFKVSPKGAVQMNGFGRFPVTLYVEQCERLIKAIPQLTEFIEANRANLATKDRKVTAAPALTAVAA